MSTGWATAIIAGFILGVVISEFCGMWILSRILRRHDDE